jgi:CheY-like chemotaxis protein
MPCFSASLLVVDDNAVIRACLSELLAEHGYRLRTSPEGFSAPAEIRREVPDLIVSDLDMPGMSGFELLSVVRRRYPSIPVIATSGAFSGKDLPLGVAADAFYERESTRSSCSGWWTIYYLVGTVVQFIGRVPGHPSVSE